MLVFGPIPSRRLGRSLGINNIPPKSCSYSCVYCQVGPTRETEIIPRPFYTPEEIFEETNEHLKQVREKGDYVDYLSFVPDGEPTLDARLGETIERLRTLDVPIAVISNASLIWREDVRATLALADWVSLKVDALDDDLWRKINRPHPSLEHQAILGGMMQFARSYKGILATETMLVKDLNDSDQAATALASFLERLAPDRAYLSLPIRPPAVVGTRAPDEAAVNRFYQIVHRKIAHLELTGAYEGNAFGTTGNVREDLLAITSVHPMREEAIRAFLERNNADWSLIEQLISEGALMPTEYEGITFYVHRMPRNDEQS
jgi:wyosine [tRNA(Phe)-imidazoG37] synthetase (radical SAM superfamily)